MTVMFSVDGTAWVDHSDQASVLEPGAQTRVTGEIAVLGEDTMASTVGKREPQEITIRGPYVEASATTNTWAMLYQQWTTACGGELNVRWAPSGTTTDDYVFTTGTATGGYSELVSLTPPGGDAATADPLIYEAVIRCPAVLWALYT
jgi:hypothetical protein